MGTEPPQWELLGHSRHSSPRLLTQGPSSSWELYLYYPNSVSNSKSGPQIMLSFLCLLLHWIFKPERSKKTILASILSLTSIASASGFRLQAFLRKQYKVDLMEKKKIVECLLYVGHCSGCSRASPKFLPSWGFHCSGKQKINQSYTWREIKGERVCVEGTSALTAVRGSLHRKGDVCFELTALSWMGLPPAKLSQFPDPSFGN